ncbi:MAG: M48 family metallopeptidase [Clostridium sp.]|nr:M48 family metallopeptidase [Clostridium sp.]
MALQIEEDGQVTVRVPRTVTEAQAEEFARRHGEWILKTREKVLQNASWRRSYTEAEKQTGKQRLSRKLEERLPLFASVMGVSYGRVSIRDQRTRWGSCSGKGNLNFNWKLSLVPDEILDYVVVHELAHRIEMNHSVNFWREVEKILPDYREQRMWLKENGGRL